MPPPEVSASRSPTRSSTLMAPPDVSSFAAPRVPEIVIPPPEVSIDRRVSVGNLDLVLDRVAGVVEPVEAVFLARADLDRPRRLVEPEDQEVFQVLALGRDHDVRPRVGAARHGDPAQVGFQPELSARRELQVLLDPRFGQSRQRGHDQACQDERRARGDPVHEPSLHPAAGLFPARTRGLCSLHTHRGEGGSGVSRQGSSPGPVREACSGRPCASATARYVSFPS